jgi:hypothetical protein
VGLETGASLFPYLSDVRRRKGKQASVGVHDLPENAGETGKRTNAGADVGKIGCWGGQVHFQGVKNVLALKFYFAPPAPLHRALPPRLFGRTARERSCSVPHSKVKVSHGQQSQ